MADERKSSQELASAHKQIVDLEAKVSELKTKQSRAYAAICEKYAEMGGSTGALGPLQLEPDDGGGAKLDFEHGLIAARQVAPGKFEAHEVHGRIFMTYSAVTPEGTGPALLGFPISDEEPWDAECPGGKRTRFERGSVVWCPGWTQAEPRQIRK